MTHGAFLLVILGLSAVHCMPSSEIKGRQATDAVSTVVAAVPATLSAATAVVPATVTAVGTAVSGAVAAVPAVVANVAAGRDAVEDAEAPVKGLPHHYPVVHLNLLSAVGHIISPLLEGILKPLFINCVYGVVGGIVKTFKNPEIDPYDPQEHGHHDGPAKFPESRAEAIGSSAITALFNGFDAYVMQVPGSGKYLFISPDKKLSESGAEADKNLESGDGYEEIPFSANPILNSIFGTIRVRAGPIPDKRVESYVKQQLGAEPEPAAAD